MFSLITYYLTKYYHHNINLFQGNTARTHRIKMHEVDQHIVEASKQLDW